MNAPQSLKDKLAAMAAKNEAPQASEAPEADVRVFYGNLPQATTYLTDKGEHVHFYQGFFTTTDPVLAAFAATIKNVEEVTGKVDLKDIPKVPTRDRARNWASAAGNPGQISPAELLQRAVANSSTIKENTQQSS